MEEKKRNPEDLLKHDEKLENSTDPQETMEGPVSSVMQNIKETAEEKGGDSPDVSHEDHIHPAEDKVEDDFVDDDE